MFLGFAIFGAIIAIIAAFSLMTAIQQHDSWIGATLLLTVAVIGTGLSIWKLPYWSNSDSKPATSMSQKPSMSSSGSQTFGASSSSTMTRPEAEKLIRQQLGKALKSIGTISFNSDNKTYAITVTNKDLIKTIQALEKDPSQAKQAKWPRFTSNFTKTSKSIQKSLGDGYTLTLGLKNESPVLVFKDGAVTKNEFD